MMCQRMGGRGKATATSTYTHAHAPMDVASLVKVLKARDGGLQDGSNVRLLQHEAQGRGSDEGDAWLYVCKGEGGGGPHLETFTLLD